MEAVVKTWIQHTKTGLTIFVFSEGCVSMVVDMQMYIPSVSSPLTSSSRCNGLDIKYQQKRQIRSNSSRSSIGSLITTNITSSDSWLL